jgi:histidyl-tRNA synthetase
MKAADRSGAPTVVIIGEDEVASGTAQVKNMIDGTQKAVVVDSLLDEVRHRAPQEGTS